ncbi:MAG TPA: hypothetical protein V7792_00805 [Candidatus Azoamicus sp. OHIO2]
MFFNNFIDINIEVLITLCIITYTIIDFYAVVEITWLLIKLM